jgi:hypothetical protein
VLIDERSGTHLASEVFFGGRIWKGDAAQAGYFPYPQVALEKGETTKAAFTYEDLEPSSRWVSLVLTYQVDYSALVATIEKIPVQ